MRVLQVTTHINIGGIANYILTLSGSLRSKGVDVVVASSGGNLEDVVVLDKVFASIDPVLADMFACQMVEKDPMSVSYLKEAVGRNFGLTDILSIP